MKFRINYVNKKFYVRQRLNFFYWKPIARFTKPDYVYKFMSYQLLINKKSEYLIL